MFITCQECNTTYRLDERLLKPTGSKVRCSQCRHKFIAMPPIATPAAALRQADTGPGDAMAGAIEPLAAIPASTEKPLEGIDLAELDAILQGHTTAPTAPGRTEPPPAATASAATGDDLDLDFESVLAIPEEKQPSKPVSDRKEADQIELDMDFEINDETPATEEETEDLDLAPAIEDAEAAIGGAGDAGSSGPSLEDDLESVLEDLELDSGGEEAAKAKPSSKGKALDDFGLEDLDFDLEGGAAKQELSGEEPELSLHDEMSPELEEPLAISKDVREITEKAIESAANELDLGLDLAFEEKGAQPEAKEEVGLSLEDDFDLELDKAPVTATPVSKAKAPKEEDLDLSGLDTLLGTGDEPAKPEAELNLDDEFDLRLDKASAKGKTTAKDQDALDEELDLAGLDSLMGSADEVEEEDIGLSLDEDLDLKEDFELEIDDAPPAKGAAGAKAKAIEDEELDLTGLDTLMGSGDDEGQEAVETAADAGLEIEELDLDMEVGEPAKAKAAAGKPGEDEIEELSFELDGESKAKPAAPKPAKTKKEEKIQQVENSKEAEEIDLSDIEQMLGGEAKPVKPAAPAKIKAPEVALGGASEIDLAEIETAIDQAEMTAEDEAEEQEEPELELDANFDASADDAKDSEEVIAEASADTLPEAFEDQKQTDDGEELDLELELEGERPKEGAGDTIDLGNSELDLSDLKDIVEEPETASKSDVIATGDIELDFQIEEDTAPAATTTRTTAGLMKAATKARDFTDEQTMETLAVEESFSSRPKPYKPRKKKSSKALVFVLILVLLGGIGYWVYFEAPKMGIEIPYISDYLNPKPKDPSGIINLATLDINSKFIENSQAGRLFIITGKVHNGYNTARNNIRLQGRLFTKGKTIAKTEFSYAGALISDQDLAALPIAEIKQRLNATAAQPQEAAGSARPGQSIAFMVVFSDLPPMDELDEFAVELVSSTPGQ